MTKLGDMSNNSCSGIRFQSMSLGAVPFDMVVAGTAEVAIVIMANKAGWSVMYVFETLCFAFVLFDFRAS